MKQSIIRIGKIGLTKNYLNQTEEERHRICVEIIKNGFKLSDGRYKLDRKAQIFEDLFVRSIEQLELEEEYEECQILKEIMEKIPDVLEEYKSETAQ